MEKLNKFVDKVLKIPGGVYGLISVFLGSLFIYLSYLNFPGYDMLNNNVSVLGIGPGLSPILFVLALISIGIFALPFFIYLSRVLNQEENDEKLAKIANKLSILTCIALCLIAFFPVVNIIIGIIHASLALIFFICGGLSITFLSVLMLRNNDFSKIHAYSGFSLAGLIVFYVIVSWSIIEWAVFFAIGIYTINISIYTLYKRIRS
jgi:hypothetical membrane protein